MERYVHVPACCGRAPRRYGCRARPLPGRRQLAGLLSGSPSARRDPPSPQKSRPGPEKDGSHALLTPPSLHLRTAESRWSPLCLRPTSTLNSAQEPPFLHRAAPPRPGITQSREGGLTHDSPLAEDATAPEHWWGESPPGARGDLVGLHRTTTRTVASCCAGRCGVLVLGVIRSLFPCSRSPARRPGFRGVSGRGH